MTDIQREQAIATLAAQVREQRSQADELRALCHDLTVALDMVLEHCSVHGFAPGKMEIAQRVLDRARKSAIIHDDAAPREANARFQ